MQKTSHHITPNLPFLGAFQTKSSNIKLPTFTKVLTSAPFFSQGLPPNFFRLVKPFFHQPTHRTRHFLCRNFRPFFGPASDSVDKPDSGVERRRKGLAQRKKLVPWTVWKWVSQIHPWSLTRHHPWKGMRLPKGKYSSNNHLSKGSCCSNF